MSKYIAWVYHSSYGCESGCCGYSADIESKDGSWSDTAFEFVHWYEEDWDSKEAFAKDFIQSHFPEYYKDTKVDMEQCVIHYC